MMTIKGHFMQDKIYFQGKKQPIRKTEIYDIDCGNVLLENRKPEDKIQVMDEDGNWFSIKVSEFIPLM